MKKQPKVEKKTTYALNVNDNVNVNVNDNDNENDVTYSTNVHASSAKNKTQVYESKTSK